MFMCDAPTGGIAEQTTKAISGLTPLTFIAARLTNSLNLTNSWDDTGRHLWLD